MLNLETAKIGSGMTFDLFVMRGDRRPHENVGTIHKDVMLLSLILLVMPERVP